VTLGVGRSPVGGGYVHDNTSTRLAALLSVLQDVIERSHINKKWFYLFGEAGPLVGAAAQPRGRAIGVPALGWRTTARTFVLPTPYRRHLLVCLSVRAALDSTPSGLSFQVGRAARSCSQTRHCCAGSAWPRCLPGRTSPELLPPLHTPHTEATSITAPSTSLGCWCPFSTTCPRWSPWVGQLRLAREGHVGLCSRLGAAAEGRWQLPHPASPSPFPQASTSRPTCRCGWPASWGR
jgi:hypothetical protein